MIPTEPTESRALAPTTGRLAMLYLALRAGGIAAPHVALVRRRLVPAVVLLSVLVALGALLASPALAERARLFEGAFGCEAGAAGCTTPDPYPLVAPSGVAVDEKTGDVYVANETRDDVQTIKVQATGGSFELIFEDPLTHAKQTTVPIAFGSSGRGIEEALVEAGVGLGSFVEVQGSGPYEYTVAFKGALAGMDVATLTADSSGLTGPNPSVSIRTTNRGGPGQDVEEFTEKGDFLRVFGKDVNKTKVEALGTLKSEEEAKDVCTAEEVALGIECQAGTPGTTPGAFTEPRYVGVDQSTGDVYIGDDKDGVVTKFTEDGKVVSSWGDGGPGEEPDGQLIGPKGKPSEHFGELSGIAVDSSGNLWVDGSASVEVEELPSHLKRVFTFEYLFEFDQNGGFETGWKPGSEPGGGGEITPSRWGIAVDSEDNVYIASTFSDLKFSSKGSMIGTIADTQPTEGISETGYGVAVDSSGVFYRDVEVTGRNGKTLDEPEIQAFAGCEPHFGGRVCTLTERFAVAHPPGAASLAVDSASAGDTVFAASQGESQVLVFSEVTVPSVVTGKPSSVSAAAATLEGSVDPSGVALTSTGCFFEYGENAAYGHVAQCEHPGAGEVPVGSGAQAVHAVIAVVAGRSYHYRLVAENADDSFEPSVGGDVVFGPPLLEGESSVGVTAGSAKLRGEVDPQSVDTRVRVQYGTSVEYGKETGVVDIGAGGGEQGVPVELVGLAPGTEYHYRFVVENVLGEGVGAVVGGDRVFVTQGEGAFRLPDGRGWELVSQRDRHGASIEPLGSSYDAGGEIQASRDGGAISYVTNVPTELGVVGFPEFGQVLSTRTSSGWVSRGLSVPHDPSGQTGVAFDTGREYRYFSEDLSEAAVQPAGGFAPCEDAQGGPVPCLSPAASEQTAFMQDLQSGVSTPLVTGCPSAHEEAEGDVCPGAVAEHANVPPGTVFGQQVVGQANPCPGTGVYCGPFFEDATGDFSHVVVDSYARLTEEPGATDGLYEWTAGKLTFVGTGTLGAAGDEDSTDDRHAISNSGTRVFWTGGGGHLYMRDTATGEGLQLDVPEAECVAKGGCQVNEHHGVKPEFQDALSEGERVFFTDTQQLTVDSGAHNESPDLYECKIEESGGKSVCDLTDLTPANGGESAGVLGTLPGVSEDGSYVYFVADGVLGDGAQRGATPGDCEVGEAKAPGEHCNLYVLHEGVTRLVAVLSGVDDPDWGAGYMRAPVSRVSPSGEWLAFMSNRSLTGYDNRDAVGGEPDEEVYLYNASSEHLVCASCNPTGARPYGRPYRDTNGEGLENGLVGSFVVWYGSAWLAANIPTWTAQTYDNALYQSRFLSDSGRLFFNTSDGLVPKDVNEQEDVYEYEPVGVGPEGARCGPGAASGSEVFEPEQAYEVLGQKGAGGAGCVALISSGTSGEESAFMDASEDGSDVFFLTAAHLVGGEIESGVSLYDARECAVSSPCVGEAQAPPECTTAESCRVAPEPQPSIYGAPSSATFNGKGNPAPPEEASAPVKKVTKKTVRCRKGFAKDKRGKCVRRPRAKKAKKANRRGK